MEDHQIARWLDATIATDGTKIQELAKHVGVSVSQISKWKSGEQPLRKPEHVFKVAEFYSVDPMRLLATADSSFRARGFLPLPIPEVDGEHLTNRLPRYVGERERRLMGKLARLGAHTKADAPSENLTSHVEEAFKAIEQMLDTVQEMMADGDDPEREGTDATQGPRSGQKTGRAERAGRAARKADPKPWVERRLGRSWIAFQNQSQYESDLAFGW